jgi:putative ABC transport system permease protein
MGDLEKPEGPPRPGWLVRLALRWLVPAAERATLLSELRELWEKRVAREGATAAGRWYRRQLRSYPVRLLRARLSGERAIRSGGSGEGAGWLAGAAAEVRHALRGWGRSPVLAATIVLTFGLGLGASTAMYAVVRAVVLDPLPYEGGDRLLRIYHAVGANRWNLSVADFTAIAAQQTRFDGVAAYTTGERTLVSDDVVERVRVRGVTTGFFELLGERAQTGRTFVAADGVPGAPRTAVVSWGFWQRSLGGAATAVGRSIRLDGQDHVVIGVLPRAVGPLEERFEVFPALQLEPPTRKGPFLFQVVGRLRTGTDTAAAAAELRAINRRIFPIWQAGWQDSTSTWGVMPLDEAVIGRFRPILLVLSGAVALLLLVAATNAAGLLTARATQRRHELSTRAALGATRTRLVRLLVTESLLLALAGAALGIGLAALALRAVRAAGPDLLPRAGAIALDAGVLGFAALLAGAGLAIFGLIPALQLLAPRAGIAQALRGGGRTTTGATSAQRMRRALVASQFAIVVPLLAGAALLVNSFLHLQRVDPGFDRAQLLTMYLARADERDPAQALFWQQLVERVEALPGVVAAGVASGRAPRDVNDTNNFDPVDRPTPVGSAEPGAVWLVATPGYFDALGIRLIEGRMFDARDTPDMDDTSVLVDRTWAENVYPGESAIGRRFYEGGCKAPECSVMSVVGVVEDVRYLGLDDALRGTAVGTVYVSPAQWFGSSYYLFVRSTADPLALLGSIRTVVRALDPALPITQVATGDDVVDAALAAPRNLAGVVAAFAAVALALAMIGIYGVLSYFVHEQRRDIGIRLALGGRPRAVLALVLERGMKPAALGMAVGFAVALAVTRFSARLLYGVSPHDPATLATVALVMLATALAACWLPAWDAARVDPARVLREE